MRGKRIPANIRCRYCVCYTNHVPSPLDRKVGTGLCTKARAFVNSETQIPHCFKKKGGGE